MSALELRAVRFPKGPLEALPPFDLSLERGRCTLAFGHGVKRLLLKVCAGVTRPVSGTVRVDAPAGRFPVSYIPHEGGLLSNLTLVQNAALPLVYHKASPPREAQEAARAAFEELGIRAMADHLPALAGVSNRRLAQFVRARLMDPALLAVEEPYGEAEAHAAKAIRLMLSQVKSEGRTALFLAASDLRAWLDFGDAFLFVGHGRMDYFPDREALMSCSDAEIGSFIG